MFKNLFKKNFKLLQNMQKEISNSEKYKYKKGRK